MIRVQVTDRLIAEAQEILNDGTYQNVKNRCHH